MKSKKVNKNLLELRDEKLMRLEAKCNYIGAFKTNIKTLAERTRRRNLEKGQLFRTAQNINTILYNWRMDIEHYKILEKAVNIIRYQLVYDLEDDQTRDRICTRDHRNTIRTLLKKGYKFEEGPKSLVKKLEAIRELKEKQNDQ